MKTVAGAHRCDRASPSSKQTFGITAATYTEKQPTGDFKRWCHEGRVECGRNGCSQKRMSDHVRLEAWVPDGI